MASVLDSRQGGTGTGTEPSAGQILIGQSSGEYLAQAASGNLVLDRLTTADASPSTFILSDDDTDQTLTGDLGTLNFVSTDEMVFRISSNYVVRFDNGGSAAYDFHGGKNFTTPFISLRPGDVADAKATFRIDDGAGGTDPIQFSGEYFEFTGDRVQLLSSTDLWVGDAGKIQLGSDQDFDIYHNGTNGFVDSNLGNLTITSVGDLSVIADTDLILGFDGSTLTLSDDNTDQTLTFNLGDLNLVGSTSYNFDDSIVITNADTSGHALDVKAASGQALNGSLTRWYREDDGYHTQINAKGRLHGGVASTGHRLAIQLWGSNNDIAGITDDDTEDTTATVQSIMDKDSSSATNIHEFSTHLGGVLSMKASIGDDGVLIRTGVGTALYTSDSITKLVDVTIGTENTGDVLRWNGSAWVDYADSNYGTAAAVALNTTHRTSDGSNHTFLDQSVISGASPTFTGTNITAVASITAADESSDTTCFPLFSTDATGTIAPKTGTNLTFNSSTGNLSATLFGGITEGNLLDKAAAETVSGQYTFSAEILAGSGMSYEAAAIDLGPAGRLDSLVTDTANQYAFVLKPTNSFTSGTDRGLFNVQDSAGTDKLQLRSDDTLFLAGGLYTFNSVFSDIVYHRFDRAISKVFTASETDVQFEGKFRPQAGTSTGRTYYGCRAVAIIDDGASPETTNKATNVVNLFTSRNTNMNPNNMGGGSFLCDLATGTGPGPTDIGGVAAAGTFQIDVRGSYTVINARVLNVNGPSTIGAGMSITNWAGLYIRDQKNAATNTAAIVIDAQTTNSDGTDNNIWMKGGDWDRGHLQLNTGHIFDAGSELLFKSAAPTSDTDVDFKIGATGITIGDGGAGIDYTITVDGETNDGVITFMEDEKVWENPDGLAETPDEITADLAGVAASITTVNTEVTTDGDSNLDNVTLANGISGQVKRIYCVVAGNTNDEWKITPANMVGGTQITFAVGSINPAGLGCTLVYADSEGWVVTANNGGAIA